MNWLSPGIQFRGGQEGGLMGGLQDLMRNVAINTAVKFGGDVATQTAQDLEDGGDNLIPAPLSVLGDYASDYAPSIPATVASAMGVPLPAVLDTADRAIRMAEGGVDTYTAPEPVAVEPSEPAESAQTTEAVQQPVPAPPDYRHLYSGLSYPQLRSMMQKFGARDPRDPSRQHLDAAISQYNVENPDNTITPMVVDNLVTNYRPNGQTRRVPDMAGLMRMGNPARQAALFNVMSNPALANRMYAPDVNTTNPNSLIQILQQKLRSRER